jgi:hypothetical protein
MRVIPLLPDASVVAAVGATGAWGLKLLHEEQR